MNYIYIKSVYQYLPQTMMVKFAPFLATILCLWFGKFAIPVPDKGEAEIGGGGGGTEKSSRSIMIVYKKEKE
jgi:hypothetical protein